MSTAKKVWLGIGVFLLILVLASGFYINSKMEQMDLTNKLNSSEAGVDETLKNLEDSSGIINIALFGVDTREININAENSRSDAMKIISIDTKNNRASITSFQRDTLIYIPGDTNDFDKLNHAYWYGGPQLAIQTLNYNFDLDVKSYVTVNFEAVEHIVDTVGGVEIEVSYAELSVTNDIINGINSTYSDDVDAPLLTHDGKQLLTGRQAVAYSRNRYVGTDFERMNRQTEVMEAVFERIKGLSFKDIMTLLDENLPYVETNLTKLQLIKLAYTGLKLDLGNIGQFLVPSTGLTNKKTVSYKGFSPLYVLGSYSDEVKLIHQNIYGNANYEPSKRVLENEVAIYNKFGRP